MLLQGWHRGWRCWEGWRPCRCRCLGVAGQLLGRARQQSSGVMLLLLPPPGRSALPDRLQRRWRQVSWQKAERKEGEEGGRGSQCSGTLLSQQKTRRNRRRRRGSHHPAPSAPLVLKRLKRALIPHDEDGQRRQLKNRSQCVYPRTRQACGPRAAAALVPANSRRCEAAQRLPSLQAPKEGPRPAAPPASSRTCTRPVSGAESSGGRDGGKDNPGVRW